MSIARITTTPGMRGDHDVTCITPPPPFKKDVQRNKTVMKKCPRLTISLDNVLITNIWCLGELHMSIVAGSLPVMKPFVRQYFPRLLDLASTRNTPNSLKNIGPDSHIPFHRLKSSGTLQQPDKVAGDRGYSMPRWETASYRTMSEGDRPAEESQDAANEQVISDEIECHRQEIKIRDR